MSAVVIAGNTSGSVTLAAPDVAGNTTLNLPASSGTVLTQNSSAPANSFVVDASGNVGIGTSSPAAKLNVETNSSSTTIGGSTSVIAVSNSNGSSFNLTAGLELYGSGTVSGANKNAGVYGLYEAYTGSGNKGALVFATNGGSSNVTERMRIDSSGDLLVGATSKHASAVAAKVYSSNCIAALSGYYCKAGQNATTFGNVFNINWTGSPQLWIDSTNVGTFAFTSDYRIKQNIQTNTTPALERIKQLRPVTYEFADYKALFKEDGVQREGFIAHELAEIIPSAVEGEKDAEDQIQSLKLDALCSVMVKAIQELKAIVDEQAEKIKALEAK